MSDPVAQLIDFFQRHPKWVLLTGAGVSAPSGIPTYRDANGRWLRNQPIQHQEFVQHFHRRQRYWGRSMVGWPGVRDARPNHIHLAITRLENLGRASLIITQNVDRLHQRAGSRDVVDLHGRLDRVLCLDCGAGYEREYVQHELQLRNPAHTGFAANARPDGDADLDDDQVAGIKVFDCEACGGVLMPDVVFFGGSVPRDRVARCEQAIAAADGLLVVGSSLQVYSGYRFCKLAKKLDKPLLIVNEGSTRADDLADCKIEHNGMATFLAAIDQLSPHDPLELSCPTP